MNKRIVLKLIKKYMKNYANVEDLRIKNNVLVITLKPYVNVYDID